MKKISVLALAIGLVSCTSVDTGKEGVLVSWGRQNRNELHP